MSVPVAYATMIVVWSTTPLGVSWSNETMSPIASVTLRMGIAAAIGFALLKVLGIELVWKTAARRTYAYSLIGVYGSMSCVYFAAQYISSGLISVLFALSPVLSNLLATKILGASSFTRTRWFAFALSFIGLIVICLNELSVGEEAGLGILLLLCGVLLYSLSGVLLQKESSELHPLGLTVGTLILSIPLFALSWLLLDGQVPSFDWDSKSPYAVLYLAIFGSLIGFFAYFYVVRKAGAIAVAMVTLATPVFALLLGSMVNGEVITTLTVVGTACVLVGLVIYYRSNAPQSVVSEDDLEVGADSSVA